jgi:DNA uptake protein ComE-like DNA-binding protein
LQSFPARGLGGIQIQVKHSVLLLLLPVVLAGCTAHQRSPDEIREQTARATSTATRDAKAFVQGVVEGVKQQRTININRSSIKDLESLPGIDDAVARRIVEHRPYSDSYDLVKRHIITRKEYGRISGKVEAR